MMAVEDDGICPTHEKNRVALYCKTCELLICTRCVSHGSQSSARHRDHVYLDLNEAFDMLQEDVQQVTSGLREDLQEKRKDMQNLQAKLQRLQLSLLRKKTQLGKCTKSLKETVKKQEKSYMSHVEGLISPSISSAQQHYTDVEFEVVLADGLLASAEALQRTPKDKVTSFLKGAAHVKKEFEDMKSKTFTTYKDDTEAQEKFTRVNLHLHREKYLMDRAFTLPTKVPNIPQPLPSWCVIGDKSASIVWKFNRTDIIKCFNVYYKKFSETDTSFIMTRERVKTVVQRVAIDDESKCREDNNHIQLKDKTVTENSNESPSMTNGIKSGVEERSADNEKYKNGINSDIIKEEKQNGKASVVENGKNNRKPHWFGLNWLFSSAKKSDPMEQDAANDGNEESDVMSESDEMQDNSEKTSVEESLTSNDEQEDKNNAEIDKPVKTPAVQRSQSYVDPCDFWKEMQLNSSNKEAFVNPYSSGSTSSNRQNNNNNNYNDARNTRKKTYSPVRRSSTSTMMTSSYNTTRSVTPSSQTRRKVVRVHSLEAPKNVVSPLLSKNRSQTPVKYVPRSSNPKISARSPSPANVRRGENLKPGGRMSRKDQPIRGRVSSPDLVKKPMECTEQEDENMKDRFNEKTTANARNTNKPIKQVNARSSMNNAQKKEETGQKPGKKKWQKNMRIIHDESEESCPTESEDKDTEKSPESESHRQRSNTFTKNDFDCVRKRQITTKKSIKKIKQTKTTTCKTEYACLKSIPSETLQTFKHFRLSRFVLGRVQATLQDLEENTNYLALITSQNQAGESEASVVHFKTSSNQPCAGHVIKKVQGHRKSWGSIFKDSCSKFCLLTFLIFYMFLVIYLISSHVQSSLCSRLAKENAQAVSKLCPDVIPEDLCSQFQSTSNQYCENVITTENPQPIRDRTYYIDNTLGWLLGLLNAVFS